MATKPWFRTIYLSGAIPVPPQSRVQSMTVMATSGQYDPIAIVLWKKQNICSRAISERCRKWVAAQFKVAGARTIPALSRIRATSANRPVCNAWGWEFHWGWGFRVNKQCGGLSGRRAPPSPRGLAWPFVAFNPSTLYWKAWGGAWLRLALQLLCVLEFLTDCLHTFGNNTVIPHPKGGWQEWQVRQLLGNLRP